jgi:hypothetical protein
MTPEQISYFRTFGFFLCKQLLSQEEMEKLSAAFDVAMEKARGGAPRPEPGEKRQQIIPFFDYDPEAFYPLLDDTRLLHTFEQLLGEDFILTLSEGIIHTGGSGWHHDAYAPEGFFSMRAALYLDPLGPEDGCLTVIPGSHCQEFRDNIVDNKEAMALAPEDLPGQYPLVNQPGDVLFMNHKVHHAALSDKPWRRAIHLNAVQNTTAEKNQEHFDWLMKFLAGETKGWGRFYSDRLIHTASPRLKKTFDRAIELGFGNTGPITQLQDLA